MIAIVFVMGGALLLPSMATAAGERPNIIFIMADDLGYGGLGCYGQTKIRTPRLDRMSNEGMRFTQAYAGCTVCAPSRSVLMTALHTGHTPVRANSGGIPLADDDVTVGEVLKAAGYATGSFGKWGLGEHGTTGIPNKQGFDEFLGFLHQVHAHFYYAEYLWKNDEKFPLVGNDGFQGQYTQDVLVQAAMDFIRKQKDNPFFVYMPLTIPHYELIVPEDSLTEYRGKFPETPFPGRGEKVGYPNGYAPQPHPRAATAAMITRMDRDVGRLLDLLAELKIDDNTLVIFTSDNGATFGISDPDFFEATGPLRGRKRDLYEGGIRVPMIARWPTKIAAGTTSDHICYFADVMPTLAELSGGKTPEGIDGLSFVPTLLGPAAAGHPQERHEFLYWEYTNPEEDFLQAVRMGDWKGVRLDEGKPLELYNLLRDVGEQTNIAADHADIVSRMETIIKDSHREPRPQIEPPKPPGRRFD